MTGTDNRDIARFRDLIDTHGAAPDRWPPAERGWAQELMRQNADAAAALDQAQALEAHLDVLTPPPPSPALMGRIIEAAPGGNGWRLPDWLFPVWRPAGALAVALLLGLAVGGLTPPEVTGTQTVAEEVDLLYGEETVAGLVLGDRR